MLSLAFVFNNSPLVTIKSTVVPRVGEIVSIPVRRQTSNEPTLAIPEYFRVWQVVYRLPLIEDELTNVTIYVEKHERRTI